MRLGKSINGLFVFLSVCALFLVACGDSGGGKEALTPEEVGVETIEDLPNCSKAREGDSVLVEEDSLSYVCRGGKWTPAESADGDSTKTGPASSSATDSLQESLAEGVQTIDDLPNCSKNREGDSVRVIEDSLTYICRSGKWEEKKYLIDSVKTEDDLPACTKRLEGDSAYVSGEYAVYVCSGNVWKKEQSIIQVYKSADDMPNCTKKLASVEAVSTADSAIFLCDGERWQEMATTFASAEKLPNCTDNREGNQAFLLDTREKFQCAGKQWKAVEEWSAESNNSSSSKNGDIQSSSSQELTYETSCGSVHYTTATAGPNHGWGNFGYVVPLKISATSTQELYLAFAQAETAITGPDAWNFYGVLIAKYNASNGVWVPGTEVFSKEKKSARPIIPLSNTNVSSTASTVNTYGLFEKFTFDTRGSWLAESSGKTVDVVVTFYAPDVKSDSSGMGWDYYSIPIPITSSLYSKTTPNLYYSATGVGCNIPVSTTKTFSCSPDTSSGDIYQGDTLNWSVSGLTQALAEQSWFSIESEAGEVVGIDYVTTYGTTSAIVRVAYPNEGQFDDFLTFSAMPTQKVQCKASNRLNVRPNKLRGCSCVADQGELVDFGSNATWTVKGCYSPNPITEYEWNGAQPVNDTTASVELSEDGITSASPHVKVWDSSGDSMFVACPKVTGVSYLFYPDGSYSNILTIPAGTHIVGFELNGGGYYCSMFCSKKNYEDDNVAVSMEGKTYYVTYGNGIELPASYCKESSQTEITTTAEIMCHVSY